MGKMYLDITQLVHWPGRLTGIPRVMNELALRYCPDESVSFVVWDREDLSFYELDKRASLDRRGEGIFYKTNHANVSAESVSSTKVKLRDHIKRAAQPVKTKYPSVYNKLKGASGITVNKGRAVEFTKDSSLFVLWGEWADDSFKKYIVNLCGDGITLHHIVYDMLPVIAPQYSGHSTEAMDTYYRTVLPLCKKVFAISESTKRDAIKWLRENGLETPEINVFRLGDDFAISKPQKPSDEIISGIGEFILCVGTIEARKNHTLLYYVYNRAQEKGIVLPDLIIVGRSGWHTDDIQSLITTDLAIKNKMHVLSNVSDEELSWLYDNCKFSIYPSFYEGWGLPIAESIAHGKVCLSSNTSSMPEVAGDMIDYFSPFSVDECLNKIIELLPPAKLKAKEASIKKYKPTSWDETFVQVEEHMEKK